MGHGERLKQRLNVPSLVRCGQQRLSSSGGV